MLKFFVIITFSWISSFAMHIAEVNINKEDLELIGKMDIGQINTSVEPATSYVGLRLLSGHKENSSQKDRDNSSYIDINYLLQNETAFKGLFLGLGVKLSYADSFSNDYVAIPLGVEAIYKIPAPNLILMHIGSSIYYAPSVLSLMDAEDYLEYRIHFDMTVIRNGQITIGYRSLDTDYVQEKGGDYTYNQTAYIGFKFKF